MPAIGQQIIAKGIEANGSDEHAGAIYQVHDGEPTRVGVKFNVPWVDDGMLGRPATLDDVETRMQENNGPSLRYFSSRNEAETYQNEVRAGGKNVPVVVFPA